MVREAEEFASDDEAQRKRIESLNSLSSFVYGLKTQLADQEGLGGKISDEDKKTILAAVKDATDWIEEHGQTASVEDLDEKLAGAFWFFPLRRWMLTKYLQRSKESSTPSLQNSTRGVHQEMRRTPFMTMTNCENGGGSCKTNIGSCGREYLKYRTKYLLLLRRSS
jgi:hypothetical protein